MKLHGSIIKYDQRGKMLLMMLSDYLYKSGWVFNLFLGLSYNKVQKQILFNDYEWLWKEGVFYKKYIEVPYLASIEEISDYLRKYIGTSYIIGYVSNNARDKTDVAEMILYYDFSVSDNKFSVCVFGKNSLIFAGRKSIYEIFKLFYPEKINTKYCFDILEPIINLTYEFDRGKLLQDVDKKKLYWRDIIFLPKSQIKKSLSIFKDWITFFELRLEWLSRDLNLEKVFHDIKIIMDSKESDRIKMLVLVSKYNKICNIVRGYK